MRYMDKRDTLVCYRTLCVIIYMVNEMYDAYKWICMNSMTIEYCA